MDIFEATKFVEKRSSQSIADEVGDFFSSENLSKGLDAIKSHLPKDVQKGLPLAQALLGGKLKGLMSGDAGAVNAALGALSKFLPPKLAGIIGKAGPLLSKGLGSLLSGKGLGDMLSADSLMGLATQFLPPWAGDAMSVAKKLASGDIAGAVDGLISKFIPPELKAAYDAIKNASGGLNGLMADLFEKPKLLEAPAGPWAARITDTVACPGGTGAIVTGLPTVKIGGQFAARVTDTATCLPGIVPDILDHGEPTVIFGGQWATRKGDFTAHKGAITSGFNTVHIGKAIGNCDGCLVAGSSGGGTAATGGAGAGAGGAATISGSGITSPFSGGESSLLGSLGDVGKDLMNSPFGDIAKNKLVDFASKKAFDAVGDLIGADKDKVYDGSNYQEPSKNHPVKKDSPKRKENEPKPQPNIFDDDNDKKGGIF